MRVNQEQPAKSLVAEFGGQVHEHGPQRLGPNGIRPCEWNFPASLICPARAENANVRLPDPDGNAYSCQQCQP